MTHQTEAERALFEAVASDDGKWPKAIERDAKGNYLLLTTANGWMWWQAARRASAAPQAQADARDAARYRWLRNQMLGVDFDWCENGITALAFEVPDGCAYNSDCDQNIDTAIAAQTKQGA